MDPRKRTVPSTLEITASKIRTKAKTKKCSAQNEAL
jgi:hypothetical protein